MRHFFEKVQLNFPYVRLFLLIVEALYNVIQNELFLNILLIVLSFDVPQHQKNRVGTTPFHG